MANHKSSEKRARQDVKRNKRNTGTIAGVRTFEKSLRLAVGEKNKDKALEILKQFTSKIDKAAQKGAVHAKTAARKISRLNKYVQTSLK